MDLGAAAASVAAQITALGVPAVVDERDLVMPGALVTAGEISWNTLGPNFDQTFAVWLVVGDQARSTALTELSTMLELLVEPLGLESATPADLLLPNHGGSLPAIRLSVTVNFDTENT